MSHSTNNKVIHISLESMLASDDRGVVFDTMQELACENIKVVSCDTDTQKAYMKLLSNQKQ